MIPIKIIEKSAVESEKQLVKISTLFHDGYVRDGFICPQTSRQLNHYRGFDRSENTTIFLAESDGRLLGSISMTIDFDGQLPINPVFTETIDSVRKNLQEPIIVVWRLVTHSQAPTLLAKTLIKNVIHTIIYEHKYTSCFIAYYVKHEKVYRRLLNGEILDRKPIEGDDVFLPAEIGLMRIDAEKLGSIWGRCER